MGARANRGYSSLGVAVGGRPAAFQAGAFKAP